MMSVKRWFVREVQSSALRELLLMLDPNRYAEMFVPVEPVEEVGELTEDDFDRMEKFLAELDEKKALSGGEAVGSDLSDRWGVENGNGTNQ